MVEIGEDRQGTPREYKPRQRTALEGVAGDLSEILTRNVLDSESTASVKKILAENLARRAFITLDLRDGEFADLFTEAKNYLAEAIKEGSPEVKAEANLWMAKILLVEAGEKENLQEKNNTLKQGLQYVLQALAQVDGKYVLKMTVLSSALQTHGDLLAAQKNFSEAEAKYREALRVFENNHFARASLGDVLNWREQYDNAETEYGIVPNTHPAYLQAQLGLAEVKMRKGESITDLEKTAKKIFDEEAPGSYLLSRAIEDLIEAWGTNEDLAPKINLLGNILLEKSYQTSESRDALFDTLHANLPYLNRRFRAKLHLKFSEAVLSLRRYEEARNILGEIPNDLVNIISQDKELNAYYELLKAEIRMKKERNVSYIESASLWNLVNQSEDPDLIARLILDKIEGYSYDTGNEDRNKENYQKIINLVQEYISPEPNKLNHIDELFKGRKLSFNRFKFTLWRRMAEALSWSKNYQEALDQVELIYREAERLESDTALATLMKVVKAQVLLLRGEIYSYKWGRQNYPYAIGSLDACKLIIENIESSKRSKEANYTLASAYFWLGEIYRYGIKNYQNARANYKKAEEIAKKLPEKSDERPKLLARIYLGLANLEVMNGNLDLAAEYLSTVDNYHPMESPFSEPAANRPHLQTRSRIYPTLTLSSQTIFGDDKRREAQLTLGSEIPLDPLTKWLRFLSLTVNEQMDLGQNS
ncbi:MAG: tetratricopeptide repeat protein, partial [Candidatus Margulisiibacteriota bacterium]